MRLPKILAFASFAVFCSSAFAQQVTDIRVDANGNLIPNTKVIFKSTSVHAGLNPGSVAGNPSALANGDLWYNSSTNQLDARINGANVALGAAGGGSGLSGGVSGDVVAASGATTIQDSGVSLTDVARKSLSLSQFTSTNLDQIATRKYKDLQNAPRKFNVVDYGAVGDGVTNDAAAIQAAINAAFAAVGGTVYFPYQSGVYIANGTLDSTTNSVLKIPSNGSSNPPITIRFEGEYVPRTSENPPSTSGVVIKSTTVGSGTYPAILAGAAYSDTSVGLSAFNYVSVEISNMMFRTSDNPTLSAIQMHNVIDMILDNVQCDTNTAYASISQPTHTNAVGIIGPGVSNHAQIRLKDVSLFGYYEGVRASEHIYFDHVAVAKCRVGLVAERGNRPFGGNVTIEWCPKMIFVESAAVLDLDVRAEVETGASWYSSVGTEISDVSNVGTGRISYVRVNANVGPVATNLGQTGAANLALTNIYSGRLTASVNGGYGRTTENTSNGTAAEATLTLRNDVGYGGAELFSSGFGNTALRRMLLFTTDTNQTNGMRYATLASAPITFFTNSPTAIENERGRFTPNGAFNVGTPNFPSDYGVGNLGVANNIFIRTATAKAWGSGNAIQGPTTSLMFGDSTDGNLNSNAYYNGTNWKYQTTNPAANIFLYNGTITLRLAGSGSADGTITWTNALTANNDGTISLNSPLSAANGGTGLSSLGTGVGTFLGTPSSANLASATTDETGSGALVFGTSPTFTTDFGFSTSRFVGGTNTVDLRNGTNAQTERIYKTYTDASNYSRLAINGDSIVSEGAGTGANFDLKIRSNSGFSLKLGSSNTDRWTINNTGHLVSESDGSLDIGASGVNRVRNIYATGFISAGRNVVAKTSNYTVTTSDLGAFFTNAGAVGEVDFTLPTAVASLTYTFYVDAAQTLKIIAGASTTIRVAGSTSTTAGNITNTTQGGCITLVAISTTKWVAQSHEGTWTVN